MNTLPGVDASTLKYRVHWHVFIIHFPISFYVAAFGFQILHLFTNPACFEEATNVALIAGTVVMIPTILTGWRSWKTHYQGAHVQIFQRKIVIAYIMQGLSIVLAVWRVVYLGAFTEDYMGPAHWLYLFGNTLLLLGAAAEGYYGGRLNHR